jgi:hypothetical protein
MVKKINLQRLLYSTTLLILFMSLAFVVKDMADVNKYMKYSDLGILSDFLSLVRIVLPFLIIVLGAIIIFDRLLRRKMNINPVLLCLIIILLFLGLKLISFNLNAGVKFVASSIILFITINLLCFLCEQINRAVIERVFFFASLFCTIIILYEIINIDSVFDLRNQFFYGNANHAGTGFFSIIAMYLSLNQSKGVLNKLVSIFLISTISIGIFMTGSRTAMISLIVFLLIYSGYFYFLMITIFTLIIFNFNVIIEMFFSGRDNRFSLWIRRYIENDFNPLFGFLSNTRHHFFEGFYATLPYSLGLIGLILLGFFLYMYTNIFFKLFFLSKKDNSLLGFLALWISFFIANIFESIFLGVLTQPIFVFILTSIFIMEEIKKSKQQVKGTVEC